MASTPAPYRLVQAVFIAFLFFFVVPTTCVALSDVIYAIDFKPGTLNTFQIGILDQNDGSFAPIGDFAGSESVPGGSVGETPLHSGNVNLEPDPYRGEFFHIDEDFPLEISETNYSIRAISRTDATVRVLPISSEFFPPAGGGSVRGIVGFDAVQDRVIVRIRRDGVWTLASINPHTGATETIFEDFGGDMVVGKRIFDNTNGGIYDPVAQKAYFLSGEDTPHSLHTLDIGSATETIVNLNSAFHELFWDPIRQRLVGIERPGIGSAYVAEIDATSGRVTRIGPNLLEGKSGIFFTSLKLFSPVDGRLYIQLGQTIYAVSAETGALLGQIPRVAYSAYKLMPNPLVVSYATIGSVEPSNEQIITKNILDPSVVLIKEGENTVHYEGDSDSAGDTIVQEGTLNINGDASKSTVYVASSGNLGGSGTVAGISNTGTLSPGSSIGTLTVNGDLSTSGTLEIEIDPDGNADKIVVNGGDVTIVEGAVLQIVPEDNEVFAADDFAVNTTYTIVEVEGAGSISGEFTSVEDDFAFLSAHLSYGTSDIQLTMSKLSGFAYYIGDTDYARALDEMLDLSPELLLLTTSELGGAVESLRGEMTAVATAGVRANGNRFSGGVARAISGVRNATGTGTGASAGDVTRDGNFWMLGLGGYDDVNDEGGLFGYDSRTWGMVGGVDTTFEGGDVLVGVAVGWAESDIDSNRSGDGSDVESFRLTGYGSMKRDVWFFDSALHYTHHEFESTRSLRVGALSGTAEADYSGDEYGAEVRLGQLQQYRDWIVEPSVSVGGGVLVRESYGEKGLSDALSPLGLRLGKRTYESGRVEGRVRFAKSLVRNNGWTVTPEVAVGVAHRIGNIDGAATARFTGATTQFVAIGIAPNRTSGLVELGLSGVGEGVHFFARYGGQFNGDQRSHQVTAGFAVNW
jgi:outer membrane autotransporter protein